MTEALTDWFDGDLVPRHVGVYKRAYPAGPYSCWDARQWRLDAATPGDAARQLEPSAYQQVRWRGLASPSGEPCETCRGHGIVDLGPGEEDDLAMQPCPDC